MLKTAVAVLCALTLFNLSTARADGEGEDSAEEPAEVAAPAPPPPPPAAPEPEPEPSPALVASTGTHNEAMQSCLVSIYSGRQSTAAADEILVSSSLFGNDFMTGSHVNGGRDDAKTFFLTKSGLFGSGASFQLFDTDGDGTQWRCSSANRLRRVNTGADSDFDSSDVADSDNEERVTADMRQGDQWGGRLNPGEGDRESVYYVRAGAKTFRVNCGVGSRSLGIGAHQNRHCIARAVRTVEGPQENVKVCQNSDDSDAEFIEKALRRREKHLRNHTPTSREHWDRVRDNYSEMRRTCTSLVANDHGAKDALKDLGKEINERINSYNRGSTSPIPRVDVP